MKEKLYSLAMKKLMGKSLRTVSVNGYRLLVDANCSSGVSAPLLLRGRYEPYETELFKHYVKPGMVVADIGANLGYYTILASRLVGNGQVYAFEPEPNYFHLLEKNIALNKCGNVTAVNKAVSNRKIKILSTYDRNKFIDVPSIKLDDFLKGRKLDMAKIDVDGSELLVLNSMKKTLKNKNLVIFIEMWIKGIRDFNYLPENILYRLENDGFRIYHIDEERKAIKPMDNGHILNLAKKRRFGVNLLCTRNKL